MIGISCLNFNLVYATIIILSLRSVRCGGIHYEEKKILPRDILPSICTSSSVLKLESHGQNLGFYLVSIQERVDDYAGGYFLIKVGNHSCGLQSLKQERELFTLLLSDVQNEALANLSHQDFVTLPTFYTGRVSVSRSISDHDSWSAITVRRVQVENNDYFIGFFPNLFAEGQVVKITIDLYGCKSSMASYRGSNSCSNQMNCCQELLKSVTVFDFLPVTSKKYFNRNLSLGYWSYNETSKNWNSFTLTSNLTSMQLETNSVNISIVGDSVYASLFRNFFRGPVNTFGKFKVSYSGKCFLVAGCSLNNATYKTMDYRVLDNIKKASKTSNVVIFSFGSHAPFITMDDLGHYVDDSIEIMNRNPSVKYLVNGITDAPILYMSKNYKDTQLCVRNTYVIAHTNEYLKYRFMNVKNAQFFDPLYLSLSSWQFSHRSGDPVHFSDAIIYKTWSLLLLESLFYFPP